MTEFWLLFWIMVVMLMIAASGFVIGMIATLWVFEKDAPDLYKEWERGRKARRDAK